MTLDSILTQLKEDRDRLDRAIAALEGGSGRKRGRPRASATAEVSGGPRRKRRHMSAAARKKISDMMKKRWAERKRRQSA